MTYWVDVCTASASVDLPCERRKAARSVRTGGKPVVWSGDLVRVDATAGTIDALVPDFGARAPVTADLSANRHGIGRELFEVFRTHAGPAETGGALVV